MNPWKNYPKYTPKDDELPTWYKVQLKDGKVYNACWWMNGWYCFGPVVDKFLDKPVSVSSTNYC